MKTDIYTKVVLTIIAGCLLYLVVKDIAVVDLAHAQTRGPVEVNIVGVAGSNLGKLGIDPFNPALPVKVIR